MSIEIRHISGQVLFTTESAADVRAAVVEAVNLYDVNLYGADLRDANLRSANLDGADLYGVNLCGANLYGANLRGVNLYGADLRDANLYDANLRGADLRDANLRGANLRDANLCGADLRGVKNAELAIAQISILPEGDIIGYKNCINNHVVKLRIPAIAKRSNASGRKCRAEFAEVLEITDLAGNTVDTAESCYDPHFRYAPGTTVRPTEPFDENRWNECSSGIHFYITKEEAVAHV